MNGTDGREGLSASLAGRIILIAVVIVFSSLSFVLGYFVGRYEEVSKPEPTRMADVAVESPHSAIQPSPPVAPEVPRDSPVAATIPPPTGTPEAADTGTRANTKTQEDRQSGMTAPPSSEQAARSGGEKEAEAKVVYTVQLGALRNASEAARIRKKYQKKGYKTYVVVAKNKKGEKVYKIRVGEFLERKDAEILSLKLRKAEGLNSFVTTGNP